jgi:hypothetical protein
MSDPEDSASNAYLVPNRDCGACTVCCRDLAIEELKKAPGIVCVHCVAAQGCGIHETRPKSCRDWFCGWRQMAQLDDTWRPDRSEILIMGPVQEIPAGYPRNGLTFELVGSLERIGWPPLVQAVRALIANNIPVFLSVRGEPGYVSGSVFLTDELRGAGGDPQLIAHMLRGALQACVNVPKIKLEFD